MSRLRSSPSSATAPTSFLTRVAGRSERHVEAVVSCGNASHVGCCGACAMPYRVAKDPATIVQSAGAVLEDSASDASRCHAPCARTVGALPSRRHARCARGSSCILRRRQGRGREEHGRDSARRRARRGRQARAARADGAGPPSRRVARHHRRPADGTSRRCRTCACSRSTASRRSSEYLGLVLPVRRLQRMVSRASSTSTSSPRRRG